MAGRFKYYIVDNKLYTLDTESHFIVYWDNDGWNEELKLKEEDLLSLKDIEESVALRKTNDISPLEYVEDLIEQDMYKTIYDP